MPAARKQPEPQPEVEFEAEDTEVEFTAEAEEPAPAEADADEAYYAPLFREVDPNWTPESPAWKYLVTTNSDGRIQRVQWATGQEG